MYISTVCIDYIFGSTHQKGLSKNSKNPVLMNEPTYMSKVFI